MHRGPDFRPQYAQLGMLQSLFVDAVVLCLTATITTAILADIKTSLGLDDAMILATTPDRYIPVTCLSICGHVKQSLVSFNHSLVPGAPII